MEWHSGGSAAGCVAAAAGECRGARAWASEDGDDSSCVVMWKRDCPRLRVGHTAAALHDRLRGARSTDDADRRTTSPYRFNPV